MDPLALFGVIQNIVVTYGAVGIFLAAFAEELFAPVAATIVVVAGGFFALGGYPITPYSIALFFTQVVIPVSTGFTLGTLIVYGLCYRFGKTGLDRFGKYLRFNWEDVLALHTRFSKGKYDEVFVFFARAVPFFPSTVVNAFYGVIRWNPFKFILITFLGIFVRATILGFLGWQLGHLYKAHIVKIQMVQSHIFSLISLVVLGFLVRAYLKRRSKRRKETVL